MSMLAETRRKQKWSVDPRNSTWSNDESKFGQKMLERMGWSKGKGLGKTEQGATEHIKVKVKNNSLGLGTKISNEDNWIAHQDDFNQLLAELNNCHGQNDTEEPDQVQTQGFSLEAKSKTSRKRVHYMKFTKGKDLSNRSETDLACIFGKRSKQTRDHDEANNGAYSQEDKELDSGDVDGQPNSKAELNTVTSTLTMQEYFAQRMAQLKKGYGENPSTASNPESINGTQSLLTESTEDTCSTNNTEENKTKKEKKKKNRKANEEKVEGVVQVPMTVETAVVQADCQRKKKKREKQDLRYVKVAEKCSIPNTKKDTAGDAKFSKKKQKQRKDKEQSALSQTHSASEKETVMFNDISYKKKRLREGQEEEQSEAIVIKKKLNKEKTKNNKNR